VLLATEQRTGLFNRRGHFLLVLGRGQPRGINIHDPGARLASAFSTCRRVASLIDPATTSTGSLSCMKVLTGSAFASPAAPTNSGISFVHK
jgi:hypothetical protein